MSTDPNTMKPSHSSLFVILAALFITTLIVANTVATKIVMVGPLAVAAGILCFPLS